LSSKGKKCVAFVLGLTYRESMSSRMYVVPRGILGEKKIWVKKI
jgi:hypothetical protein